MAALHFRTSYRSVIQTGTVCGIPMTLTGNDLFPRKFSIFYYVFLSFFQIYGGACGIYAMMGNDFEDSTIAEAVELNKLTGIFLMIFYTIFNRSLQNLYSKSDDVVHLVMRSGLGREDFFESSYLNDSRFLCLLHKVLTGMTIACPAVYCFSAAFVEMVKGKHLTSLPMPVYCPFEEGGPGWIEVALVSQFVGIALPAVQKLVNEFIIFGLLKIQSAYFKYLVVSINLIQEELRTSGGKAVGKKLAAWLDIHQQSIKMFHALNGLFSPVLVAYYLSIITIVASGLFYQLNAERPNFMQTTSVGAYMTISIIQFGLLCYIAEEVSQSAGEVAAAAYNIPWHELEFKERRMISLIINMGNRPIRMAAYKTMAFIVNNEAFQAFMINLVSAYMGFSKIKNRLQD